MDRRAFIKLTAVSGTTAALASCGDPDIQVLRFVPGEDIIPGQATLRPSVCPLCASGCGLTVRLMDADHAVERDGEAGIVRILAAKKLEGSAAQPISQGALCARGQAAIQVAYHPDRITQPLKRAGERGDGRYEAIDWAAALAELTGSPALMRMDAGLRHARQPERRLADVVKPLAAQFDVVVLDAPAGYSVLSLSVPLAADELVVPLRAEYLSLESVAQFLAWYRDRHLAGHARARISGILLTMVDYRRQATREIVDIIRLHNRRGVFRTEIPPDPRVAEAPSHGVPLVHYAPSSRASRAYEQVTAELLKRVRKGGA